MSQPLAKPPGNPRGRAAAAPRFPWVGSPPSVTDAAWSAGRPSLHRAVLNEARWRRDPCVRSLVLRFASGVEQGREVDQVPLAERKLHRLAA